MQPSLNEAIQFAREAGELLLQGFGLSHDIQVKGATDLVTEIDHQSEALLVKRILARFPSHRIITEESGSLNGESESCWYIDPLDGTINYAHGLPLFSVSLAYAERGELRLGVIFDPFHDEVFTAEAGRGAALNGNPIFTSQTSHLSNALLVTGLPHNLDNSAGKHAFALFEKFTLLTQGVRRLGSAALDLCYVACGRLDGFYELEINHYDLAAGALIVREAGGFATRADGDANVLTPPCSILAANPAMYPVLLRTINNG
jgi:myo-inositol-1(or 4)-monophosphatase